MTSTGVHLLLVVVLFVGSGFHSAPKKADIQELTFIPTIFIPDGPSGGGTPRAAARAPTPAPPTPVVVQPAPSPQKSNEPELDPVKPKRPQLSAANLTPVIRRTDSGKSQKQAPKVDPRRQQLAQAAELINRTAGEVTHGATSATKVEDPGPGGGGPSYASYAAWVQKVYLDAWVTPDDAARESAIAEVSVTIGSDGRVLSSKFLHRSGDAQVDTSVQRTLNRVTDMGQPFPEGMKDKERTYILRFDLRAKRGLE